MSIIILSVVCAILVLVIIFLFIKVKKANLQIQKAESIIDDVACGNFNRRIVTGEDELTSELCYKINDLVMNTQDELIKLRQSEKEYRKLITSLSHDIRTPLASLMGYLDAVNSNMIDEDEKSSYVAVSLSKAFDLKDYVDTLFEWLKLESGERIFNFENTDVCELTRNIITNWIPQLEDLKFSYDIDIPDESIYIKLDESAFQRIINNLIQNMIVHSGANEFGLKICSKDQKVEIKVSDNGVGISKEDLPFIFDRLYKCNSARGNKGNGLGLAIVKELVKAHKGEVSVSSEVNKGTTFTIVI